MAAFITWCVLCSVVTRNVTRAYKQFTLKVGCIATRLAHSKSTIWAYLKCCAKTRVAHRTRFWWMENTRVWLISIIYLIVKIRTLRYGTKHNKALPMCSRASPSATTTDASTNWFAVEHAIQCNNAMFHFIPCILKAEWHARSPARITSLMLQQNN